MAARNSLQPTTLHSFDTSTLTGSYQVVQAGGFEVDLAIYKMYNGGSTDVDISYNGIDDHDVCPAGGTFILDVQANKEGARASWPAGRETWVKGTASSGTLYETGYSIKRAS